MKEIVSFYGTMLHLIKKVMSNYTYGIVTTSRKQHIMRFRILYTLIDKEHTKRNKGLCYRYFQNVLYIYYTW